MAGEPGEVAGADRPQRVERGGVQPPALTPEHLMQNGVAHEGVAEAEVVVAVLDQKASPDERSQPVDERRFVARGDDGEHIERRFVADDRHRLDQPPLFGGHAVELASNEIGERPGEGLLGEPLGVDRSRGVEQLLQEERVAAGASDERVDHRRGHRTVVHGVQERGDVGAAQRAQGHGGDRVGTFEMGEQLATREALGDLVRPVADDENDVGRRAVGEAGHDGDRAGIGPVQILDDDDADPLADAVEDQLAGGGRRRRRARAAGLDAVDTTEQFADELVRLAERTGLGLAGEDDHRCIELGRQLA